MVQLEEILSRAPELIRAKLFTPKQIAVVKKKSLNQKLTLTERTYYYKFIRPKIIAILPSEKVYVNGHILPERIQPAKKILEKMQRKYRRQKILISGSYLFSKKYNDIDVFIFSKYNKSDYRLGKIHVSFIQESALDSLFVCSAAKISVSNFKVEEKPKNLTLKDVLATYELLINEILNKDDYSSTLRTFLIQVEYFSKSMILNPQQLYQMAAKVSTIPRLSHYLVDGLVPIDEFKQAFHISRLSGEKSGNYHTVGGFVMYKLGHIPASGDNFEINTLKFEVVDMDGNRIDKILVIPLKKNP